VRELENYVERALILHAGSPAISFDPPRIRASGGGAVGEHGTVARAREARWSLDRLEREYILAVMEETRGNQVRAAEILGVDRRTLYRKLRAYREEGVAGV
jgi:DNA-binding NtrC family response regulator